MRRLLDLDKEQKEKIYAMIEPLWGRIETEVLTQEQQARPCGAFFCLEYILKSEASKFGLVALSLKETDMRGEP